MFGLFLFPAHFNRLSYDLNILLFLLCAAATVSLRSLFGRLLIR